MLRAFGTHESKISDLLPFVLLQHSRFAVRSGHIIEHPVPDSEELRSSRPRLRLRLRKPGDDDVGEQSRSKECCRDQNFVVHGLLKKVGAGVREPVVSFFFP